MLAAIASSKVSAQILVSICDKRITLERWTSSSRSQLIPRKAYSTFALLRLMTPAVDNDPCMCRCLKVRG